MNEKKGNQIKFMLGSLGDTLQKMMDEVAASTQKVLPFDYTKCVENM